MSTAWVAGVVRGRALAQRRLGAGGARHLAEQPSLDAALGVLHEASYGHDVSVGQDLRTAQRGVAAAVLWNLRVLAGWLPRDGAEVVRTLAGGFEVANVEAHLARLQGSATTAEPFALGTLDVAGQRLAAATSVPSAQAVLEASPWRVRAGAAVDELQLALRLAWADAVAARVPEAATWARAAAVLQVLRRVAVAGEPVPPSVLTQASAVVSPAFAATVTTAPEDLDAVRASLPSAIAWVLEGVAEPAELWRAEARWWLRVEDEAFALLRGSGYGRRPVVGVIGVLAVDAWRVRAALECAARGGSGAVLEAFDAVA
ncbi:hypothetical protein [Rhodococcus sp. X156]|uniref:hypothetical protein n=1 Tax=Rhodococcus sp. X156 TaxID=2499145 RepID=UPI000FD924B2|nr:hypothetical protein [Rhodococcus sp. X156]